METYRPKQATDRVIMHIDYDSFFASVEQQVNPKLRGKPIAVGGSSVRRGIVCAASREAKKLGVKTAMPLFKAKEICPNLIMVRGDGTKYKYIQKESLRIFANYTDKVEPFSIDEAFLDVTATVNFFPSVRDMALKIKEDIRNNFGEYITCSIGIGPNKLVAKLVSDLEKPNGIVIVTPNNMQEILTGVELEDFCGIGKRLGQRLRDLNINTVEDLQKTPLYLLYQHFGNVAGSFLKNASLGIHVDEVKSGEYKRPIKSISHQHTLLNNTKNPQIILYNIRRLTEMVAKRARNNNMLGKTVHLALRDSERGWEGFRKSLPRYTNSSIIMYRAIERLYEQIHWNKETRLVGVGISNLIQEKYNMTPLFLEDQKNEKVIEAMDIINNKFGSFTIIPACTLKADETKNKISSFLRHE